VTPDRFVYEKAVNALAIAAHLKRRLRCVRAQPTGRDTVKKDEHTKPQSAVLKVTAGLKAGRSAGNHNRRLI
jgi:hypothetical protein